VAGGGGRLYKPRPRRTWMCSHRWGGGGLGLSEPGAEPLCGLDHEGRGVGKGYLFG
jgi:hypothetical protein